jgi:hypothetical protein
VASIYILLNGHYVEPGELRSFLAMMGGWFGDTRYRGFYRILLGYRYYLLIIKNKIPGLGASCCFTALLAASAASKTR